LLSILLRDLYWTDSEWVHDCLSLIRRIWIFCVTEHEKLVWICPFLTFLSLHCSLAPYQAFYTNILDGNCVSYLRYKNLIFLGSSLNLIALDTY
jgi:hypothetical protein